MKTKIFFTAVFAILLTTIANGQKTGVSTLNSGNSFFTLRLKATIPGI